MSCYAMDCARPPTHELLGEKMCTPHYIEALEHSAHIVLRTYERERELRAEDEARLERLVKRVDARRREKLAREAARGRVEGNEPFRLPACAPTSEPKPVSADPVAHSSPSKNN